MIALAVVGFLVGMFVAHFAYRRGYRDGYHQGYSDAVLHFLSRPYFRTLRRIK